MNQLLLYDVIALPAHTHYTLGYGKFSLRLIGSAMFGATFNLVTSVGVRNFKNTEG